MEEEGIEFITGVDVGKDTKAKELLKDYDRVILACGASNPRDIQVARKRCKRHLFCSGFPSRNIPKSLLDSNLEDGNYVSAKDKNVVIIGGGDTGNDCVGT
jgi:glutamate synthase (NADPH) small chain